MEHNDYPNPDKNGVYVSAKVVVGDFYDFPGDKGVMSFLLNAKILDKDIGRIATEDDADFAFYTKLLQEMKNDEKSEQATLLHTLLKVTKSDIITSPGRITEEYRAQQKKLKNIRQKRKHYVRKKKNISKVYLKKLKNKSLMPNKNKPKFQHICVILKMILMRNKVIR